MIKPLKSDQIESFPGLLSRQAEDIFKLFKVSKAVPERLTQKDISSEMFLRYLMQEGLHNDAISFLAHGLPQHTAIQWANDSVRQVLSKEEKRTFEKALGLINQWIQDPTDEKRFTIGELSEDLEHSIDWLRMAIFWSGPNISSQPNVTIAPDKKLAAQAVSTTIILATVQGDVQKITQHYQMFLDLGLQIAKKPIIEKAY